MCEELIRHYDLLIDEENDPFRDPPVLRAYMDEYDGAPFFKLMRLEKRMRVLEIGVGTGRLAAKAAPLCKDFTGIDLSPKTVCRAKENLADFPGVKLICGDFMTARFSERFDLIYSSLTFFHIERKREAYRRVYDLLLPGGRFVLSAATDDSCSGALFTYGDRVLRIFPDSPDATASMLSEAGFSFEKRLNVRRAVLFSVKKPEDAAPAFSVAK